MTFPINYQQPIFRPPSEGKSFLLQITIGCSNNRCTYCDMYRSKQYRQRDFKDIEKELVESKRYFQSIGQLPKRIFLCDGDALGASYADLLLPTLELINELYPDLDRVGIYATAQNMLDKTEEELRTLSKLKLNMVYLGLESGHDKILHMIVKGNTAQEMIDGSKKLMDNGFKLSVIAMLGIGGEKLTQQHIDDTASIISEISPEYFSFLTTMAIPGTPYHKMVERGTIKPLSCKQLFIEMREILAKIQPTQDILFRANHVSNQYPLGGVLPKDSSQIIQVLDGWIAQTPDSTYPPMPSSM